MILPSPLVGFRAAPNAPPAALASCRLRLVPPPYRMAMLIPSWRSVADLPSDSVAPTRGMLLVCDYRGARPDAILTVISWLRGMLPWLSLVVRISEGWTTSVATGLSIRVARRGAVPVPSVMGTAEIAGVVAQSFDGRLDLVRWLSTVVPGWPASLRSRAADLFQAGYTGLDEKSDVSESRSRQPLWSRVGRAVRAATALERDPDAAYRTLAYRVGFSAPQSMDRAFERLFGVNARDIRGAAGVEWLLWRFLTGVGSGKETRWHAPR